MPASRRDRDPFGYLDLRSSPAQTGQTGQTGQPAEDAAADARRYLRRRRELLLCVLVAVLGVTVARSIPLVEHEQELCDCQTILRDTRRPVNVKRVLTGLTPLGPIASAADGPVDVVITDDGVLAESQHGRVMLAERCGSMCEVWTR